ncbi:MAG TPA: hypothetical protein VGQ83_42535 [Polyangia bacterium]|jgi:hypothetical protein
MNRTLLALAAGLALLTLSPGRAAAAPPIAPTAVRIEIGNRTSDGNDISLISTSDQPKMFNIANCQCGVPRTLKVTIGGASAQAGTTNVYFYLGSNCADQTSRTSSCRQVGNAHRLSEFFSSSVLQDVTTDEVVSPVNPSCTPSNGAKSGSNSFFVMVDFKGDQSFASDTDTVQSLALNYNVQPPGLVTDLAVKAGENALNLTWAVPADTDLAYVQVLCGRGELPVFAPGTFGPVYQSADTLCPPSGDGGVGDGGQEDAGSAADAGQQDAYVTPTRSDAGTSAADGGVVTGTTAYPEFVNLDPRYVCTGGLGATAASARIDGLQNGTTYYVAVVAVNKAGNASQVETMVAGEPQEVLDFWEDYKREGGAATGCSVEPIRVGWAGAGLGLLVLGLAVVHLARRGRGGRP